MEKNLRTIFFCRTYFPINPVCFRLQGALLNIFNTSFDKKLCRFRSDTLSHIPAKNVSLCPPAGCLYSLRLPCGKGGQAQVMRESGCRCPRIASKKVPGLVAEPYVASVVKRCVSVHHPFCCPVFVYQQRVCLYEPCQCFLALSKGFFYEGIAVACQYYLGLFGRHVYHFYLVHGYVKAVNDGVIHVLA